MTGLVNSAEAIALFDEMKKANHVKSDWEKLTKEVMISTGKVTEVLYPETETSDGGVYVEDDTPDDTPGDN